ncbi:hypothetical protein O181_019317 [Austropuccinia psidii MF-1]|uniref:Uncharacterized protein n=1 Tax=Austropuccinia psidii MF-1 TaxID=1389203 RepID=A0A9Q3C9H4_9BASI|nr:hypothetical protein [Austropuccinia psidii MF-1]
MSCTLCTKGGIPCIYSSTTTDACDACSLSDPSNQAARCRCEYSFVVSNDESIPKRELTPGPQTDRWEQFQTISPVPSNIDFSTPLLGHHPMVTSPLDQSKVIIRLMKDGNGKRIFELGPIVIMSCHPWDSNTKNPPNPMSHLFLAQFHPLNHMRMFQLVSLNLRWLQCNPWRNLLVSPSLSSPFLLQSPAHSAPPPFIIIIDDMPVRSSPCVPPPFNSTLVPSPEIPPISPKNPTASSPHSHNEALQELTDL